MSVIIRLQNLPWTANAADIRHFFHGLSIPEGGVHIVGGQLGDAFIAFSTDEDARRGMALDGGLLKDSRVRLLLSSRNEMQTIIEETRQRHLALQAGLLSRPMNGQNFPVGAPQRPFAPEPYQPSPVIQPPAAYNPTMAFQPVYEPSRDADYHKSPDYQNGQRFEPYPRPFSRSSDDDRSRDGSRGRFRRSRDDRRRSRSRSRDRRRKSTSNERYRDRSKERIKFQDGEGACVQFRYLSGDLTYRLIRDYLDGLYMPNENIKMVNSFDGFRFGMAYIKFPAKSDQQKALARDNGTIRGHSVQIHPADDRVFEDVIDSYSPGIPLNPKHFPNSCLCFRDFPPFASAQTVRDALGTISIRRVVPERNASGTVTGLCFIELLSETDARKAIQLLKDGVLIAGRPVRATLLPIAELNTSATRNEKLGFATQEVPQPAAPQRPAKVILSGLPPSVMERDVADFFSDVGVMPQAIEMDNGVARCQFGSLKEAERALGKDGAFLSGSTVAVQLDDDARRPASRPETYRPQFAEPRSTAPRFDAFGPGGEPVHRFPRPPRFEPAPPGGAPGCVVALSNVPPQAKIADIVEFFRGFRVDDRCVFRRFGPAGEPTGDARVAFETPDEAEAALRARRNGYLMNRRVHLEIV